MGPTQADRTLVDSTKPAALPIVKIPIAGRYERWLTGPDQALRPDRVSMPDQFNRAWTKTPARKFGTGWSHPIALNVAEWNDTARCIARIVCYYTGQDPYATPGTADSLTRLGAFPEMVELSELVAKIQGHLAAVELKPETDATVMVSDRNGLNPVPVVVPADGGSLLFPEHPEIVADRFNNDHLYGWFSEMVDKAAERVTPKGPWVRPRMAAIVAAFDPPELLTHALAHLVPIELAVWAATDLPDTFPSVLWRMGILRFRDYARWYESTDGTVEAIRAWMAVGVSDAGDAARWTSLGCGPADVEAWAVVGVTSSISARNWHKVGVESPDHLNACRDVGITRQKDAVRQQDRVAEIATQLDTETTG